MPVPIQPKKGFSQKTIDMLTRLKKEPEQRQPCTACEGKGVNTRGWLCAVCEGKKYR